MRGNRPGLGFRHGPAGSIPTGPRLGSGVLSEGRGLPVGLVPLLGGSFLSSSCSCFSAGSPTSFEMPCAFRRTSSSGSGSVWPVSGRPHDGPRIAGLPQVPKLAEFPGSLQAFLRMEPLVLHALRILVPGLFSLPAVLACVASLGRGCFLMGAVAVGLGDAAFRLLRTAGPGGRVFRVLGSAFLPGPAALELSLLPWVLPGRGKENSKVRPSARLGGNPDPRNSTPPLTYTDT